MNEFKKKREIINMKEYLIIKKSCSELFFTARLHYVTWIKRN